MPISMPPVESKFFQLKGGLDLVSAATMIKPGFVMDASNYEIDSVNGGYARINGYERFDGRVSPSSAPYHYIAINLTGTISVGNTVTGAASTNTGVVLATGTGFLILGRASGVFSAGENLQVAAVTQATVTSIAVESGAATAADDALYKSLAAANRRADIGAVPGAGAILGVHVYNDTVYAWRNDAETPTKAVMYKATASGWVAVTLYKEIAFSTGLVKPAVGAVLFGTASSATGVVKRVVTRTGAWGSTAAGYVVIDVTGGTFNGTETLKLTNGAGAVQMTSTSTANQMAFAPSGSFECSNYNFTGSTDTKRMYGCDGVSPAFEFDGTTLAFIRTGMTEDKPSHMACHSNYLFLSFKGSIQNSGIGDPYAFSLVLGSSEIAVGDDVTAMIPQAGDAASTALAIFTKTKTFTLYGTSASVWRLAIGSPDAGAYASTAQNIGTTFALGNRGVQQIAASQSFGDFDFATISGLIQPLINNLRGKATASAAYHSRNQYRLFFSGGEALAFTFSGTNLVGVMPIYYTNPVKRYATSINSTGAEVCYFGSSNGYVYQDNVGTSFDGGDIEAWLRLPFNHFGSPRYLKRFRRVVLDMLANTYTGFSVSHELSEGSYAVEPGITQTYESEGGYWNQFDWDSFVWDSASVLAPVYSINGSGRNVSTIFYSNSALFGTHSIQGAHFDFSVRRLSR